MVTNTAGITNPFATSRSTTTAIEGIVHTYQDHANEDARPHLLHQLILESTVARNRAEHPFPIKLHYVLGKVSEDGLSHVVSWQPHGRCFLVHDQKEFVDRVLKCWFRQSKFASFQRQLNLYGFRRLTTGRDKGGYYHEFFLRSRPLLAHRIVRTTVKGTGTRKPSSPETEPNFYLMDYLPNESKQPSIDPAAVRVNIQNLLPTTLGNALQPLQPLQPLQQPQLPQPSTRSTANQVLSQVAQNMPQLAPNLSLPSTLPQTPNIATIDIGTSDERGASPLTSLMSYWASDTRAPATSSQNTNALNAYEAILSTRGCGNKTGHS